jgi:hypothetical protein
MPRLRRQRILGGFGLFVVALAFSRRQLFGNQGDQSVGLGGLTDVLVNADIPAMERIEHRSTSSSGLSRLKQRHLERTQVQARPKKNSKRVTLRQHVPP